MSTGLSTSLYAREVSIQDSRSEDSPHVWKRRHGTSRRLRRREVANNAQHRSEAEVLQEPLQALLRVVKVSIVPEPAERAGPQHRLVRVDLPRMQIKDRR